MPQADGRTDDGLFAAQLDLLGRGWRAGVLGDLGYILTPVQCHLTADEMVKVGSIDEQDRPVGDLSKSPGQSAPPQAWAATSPRLIGKDGLHCA